MNAAFDKETHLKLLKLLQEEPELTQREMNQKMGVSLGKINFCISALSQKGMIKVERFKKAKNKSVYIYRLTPKGFDELARLTLSFLKLKIQEYDKIKQEIKALSEQINKIDPELYDNSELLVELKKLI
jgi:EPS-associated MarR family transcriptional regulator